MLSAAEEKLLVVSFPPHLCINIWTKINAYAGCFHLLRRLRSFNEKIISAMEEQWLWLQRGLLPTSPQTASEQRVGNKLCKLGAGGGSVSES